MVRMGSCSSVLIYPDSVSWVFWKLNPNFNFHIWSHLRGMSEVSDTSKFQLTFIFTFSFNSFFFFSPVVSAPPLPPAHTQFHLGRSWAPRVSPTIVKLIISQSANTDTLQRLEFA